MEGLAHIKTNLLVWCQIRAPILSAFAELIPFRETDSLYAIVSLLVKASTLLSPYTPMPQVELSQTV